MNAIEQRLQSLRNRFESLNVDAVLIESPSNRLWLSGFSGSSGRLLITAQQSILATDSRYWIQAANEAPDYELFQDNRVHEDTIRLVKSANVSRIGIEADHLSLAQADQLMSIDEITWVPLGKIIEPLRTVKSPDEIEEIRKASAITDLAMNLVPELVYPGIKERELAWQLEKTMRENGASRMAFPIIVAFGSNSALPHHHPGERVLKLDEIVLVDMGADINGYKSDMTRTFYYGSNPSNQFTTVYNLVHSALDSAADSLRPGINSQEAHQVAADTIAEGGYGEFFPHGLGHNVGLDIHEEPFLSALRPPQEIVAGMIITIEPGIYLPGWGGVRIEDLVLVTETGLDTISKCPKIGQIRI